MSININRWSNNVDTLLIIMIGNIENTKWLISILKGLNFNDVKLNTKIDKGLNKNIELNGFGSLRGKKKNKKALALIQNLWVLPNNLSLVL